MQVKVVSLSPRGQLVIPAAVLKAMGIKGRTDLALVQDGKRLIVTKAADVGKKVMDEADGFQALGMAGLAKVWDNPYDDEAWNDL